jgi:hypothetical protein
LKSKNWYQTFKTIQNMRTRTVWICARLYCRPRTWACIYTNTKSTSILLIKIQNTKFDTQILKTFQKNRTLSKYISTKIYCWQHVHECVCKNTLSTSILLIKVQNLKIHIQIWKTVQNSRRWPEYIHTRLYCQLHIHEPVYTNT